MLVSSDLARLRATGHAVSGLLTDAPSSGSGDGNLSCFGCARYRASIARAEEVADCVGSRTVRLAGRLGVHAKGYLRIRVAKADLGGLHVDAGAYKSRSGGMTQVMEVETIETNGAACR